MVPIKEQIGATLDLTTMPGPLGLAQLGYGDGDEETVIGFGGDLGNKHITTYFRSTFQVDDPTRLTALSLSLLFDDGVAVYINGQPAARFNLADDADYDSFAEKFSRRTGRV